MVQSNITVKCGKSVILILRLAIYRSVFDKFSEISTGFFFFAKSLDFSLTKFTSPIFAKLSLRKNK